MPHPRQSLLNGTWRCSVGCSEWGIYHSPCRKTAHIYIILSNWCTILENKCVSLHLIAPPELGFYELDGCSRGYPWFKWNPGFCEMRVSWRNIIRCACQMVYAKVKDISQPCGLATKECFINTNTLPGFESAYMVTMKYYTDCNSISCLNVVKARRCAA